MYNLHKVWFRFDFSFHFSGNATVISQWWLEGSSFSTCHPHREVSPQQHLWSWKGCCVLLMGTTSQPCAHTDQHTNLNLVLLGAGKKRLRVRQERKKEACLLFLITFFFTSSNCCHWSHRFIDLGYIFTQSHVKKAFLKGWAKSKIHVFLPCLWTKKPQEKKIVDLLKCICSSR